MWTGVNSAQSAPIRPAETAPHTVQPHLTTDLKVGGSTPSRRHKLGKRNIPFRHSIRRVEQVTQQHTTISSTMVPMNHRPWIVVLVGSILVGTATLLIGLGLHPVGCSGPTGYVDASFCPPRMEVLWFRLSETEVIIWSVIVGASVGALLGLLVDRLCLRQRSVHRTRWGIVTAVIVLSAIVTCTGAPIPPSPSEEPAPFARYFFFASGAVGVLEVSQSPPSICYSTQSSPARPISIIPASFVSGPPPGAPAGVSYAPRGNDFCDRTVESALAAALIADPSGYFIRWRPEAGAPAVSSSLAE
jgi:hypothetical protein